MSHDAPSLMSSEGTLPSVVRVRLNPSSVDPRLSFFASPGDAVCDAYEDVVHRLLETGGGRSTFVVVASQPSIAQSVVAANLGSALAINADVVLVDGRGPRGNLADVFGLTGGGFERTRQCFLVSERLCLAAVDFMEEHDGQEPFARTLNELSALGEVMLMVTDRAGALRLAESPSFDLGGLVILLEQDELATGVLESFVRETGSEDILGCLVVENGRLST